MTFRMSLVFKIPRLSEGICHGQWAVNSKCYGMSRVLCMSITFHGYKGIINSMGCDMRHGISMEFKMSELVESCLSVKKGAPGSS